MTEPTPESAPPPASPGAAEPPPVPVEPGPGWVLPPTPAPQGGTPSGWIQPGAPGGGGRSRGCCLGLAIVGVIAGLLLIMPLAFAFFLDSQMASALAGSVEFEESDVVGCYVQQPRTTFPASATIHYAAHFERQVPAGEAITVAVTYPDGTSDSSVSTFDEAADCVNDTIAPGLEPGHWALEFRAGSDVLATGGFDITP